MRKFRSRLILGLVLAGICLPQTSTTLVTPDIRRVGDRLACKCGACNNTVGNCPMLECHYALPAREKIDTSLKAGMADQAIVDGFVKEGGLAALAVPPAEGFNLLAWIMPFIALVFGLGVVMVWFKRFSRPRAVAPVAAPEVDRRYQDRIDREMENFE